MRSQSLFVLVIILGVFLSYNAISVALIPLIIYVR